MNSVRNLISAADELERAVVISLFSWRRAEASDPVDDDEHYGFWGDTFPDVARDRLGSRLWLLRRRSLTAAAVQDAERYAREALTWLIDDLVVNDVLVRLVRQSTERLDLYVTLVLDDGQRELQFDDVLGVINAV